METTNLTEVDGGGCSPWRTGLRCKFPANREFTGNFLKTPWTALPREAQFMRLWRKSPKFAANPNREF